MADPASDPLVAAVRSMLGKECSFRPGQEEGMRALLQGRDLLWVKLCQLTWSALLQLGPRALTLAGCKCQLVVENLWCWPCLGDGYIFLMYHCADFPSPRSRTSWTDCGCLAANCPDAGARSPSANVCAYPLRAQSQVEALLRIGYPAEFLASSRSEKENVAVLARLRVGSEGQVGPRTPAPVDPTCTRTYVHACIHDA